MTEAPNKKRPTIGVLVGGLHTYFPKEIITGVAAAAKEKNIDVMFFLQAQTKGFFHDVLGFDFMENFDYQYDVVNDYSFIAGLDGLIINYGTIGIYLDENDSGAFAEKYNEIPLVFLTEIVDAPNCHSIISDNIQGMSDVINHLIEEHGCKKILYMSGPKDNTDARERLQGYLKVMKHHQLPVDDTMIRWGDFSEFVDDQVEELLDAHPDADAIAFANDEMAFAGYKVCRKRGLAIGTDIRITGFDNNAMSGKMTPPLTTAFQDGVLMGRLAVLDLLMMMCGEKLKDRRVKVQFVERESCGCESKQMHFTQTEIGKRVLIQKLTRELTETKQHEIDFQRKTWFIPMMTRELNEYMSDEHQYCLQVMNNIKRLHVENAALFLLETPTVYHRDGRKWTCPDDLRLASYMKNGEVFSYQVYERPLVSKEEPFAKWLEDEQPHQYHYFLLFSGERQYGMLALEIPTSEFTFFFMFSLQIGVSLRYLEISSNEAAIRAQLMLDMENMREKNHILDMVSGYDAMTGLLNVRGFTKEIERLGSDKTGEKAYVICADLDHLKQINDSFGHVEGNFAICSATKLLDSCIKVEHLSARTGGDEFVCIALSSQKNFAASVQKRIIRACEKFNAKSPKPYYVEMSVGISPIMLRENMTIQDIIQDADHELYKAKKIRRQCVIRETGIQEEA